MHNNFTNSIHQLRRVLGVPDDCRTPEEFAALAERNVHFCSDTSEAWLSYFPNVAPQNRHVENCRRRIGHDILEAECGGKCRLCWMPLKCCICHAIPKYGAAVAKAGLDLIILFHPQEFLRISNTAHIAAQAMDAHTFVWGIPEQESELLAKIEDPSYQTLLLYPSKTAVDLQDLHSLTTSSDKVRIILSDGTWAQASTLARRLPSTVQHVAIAIPHDYKSLFAPLRCQTRETGVSTLEATVLAVKEFLSRRGMGEEACEMEKDMSSVMKMFVDSVRVFKHVAPHYGILAPKDIVVAKTVQREAHQARQREAIGAGNTPLPAPVLCFCYVCNAYVGWKGMQIHVNGAGHQEKCKKGRTWEPDAEAPFAPNPQQP